MVTAVAVAVVYSYTYNIYIRKKCLSYFSKISEGNAIMGCGQSTDGNSKIKQQLNTSETSVCSPEGEVNWKEVLNSGISKENVLKVTAEYLRECLSIPNEIYVIEVICVMTEEEIRSLCDEYNNKYGKEITVDIRENCSEEIAEILCGKIVANQKTDEDIEQYGNKLVEGIGSTLFENDQLFQNMLASYSREAAKAILELFLKKCQRDITVEIEKHYSAGQSKTTKDGFLTFAKIIRNPHLYLAEEINALMNTSDVSQMRHLCFTVLTQSEENMRIIKENYRSLFFESLSVDIANANMADKDLQKSLKMAVGRG